MNPSHGIMLFARMGSQRFPGKMLHPFAGMPLLEWMIRRARRLPWPLVLATSVLDQDDAIVDCATRLDVPVYRGSHHDVLCRAIACAQDQGLTAFARLCGDRPYFDLAQMHQALILMSQRPDLDLISNNVDASATPGLTTEVVATAALQRVQSETAAAPHREHVTSWIYQHPQRYRIHALPGGDNDAQPMAVDTLADLLRLSALASDHADDDYQ